MPFLKRLLGNSSGVSLVNVLVGFALAGVLSIVLIKLSERQNRQQKKAMVDGELTETLGHLRTLLSKPETCELNLIGRKRGEELFRLQHTSDPSGNPFAYVGSEEEFRQTKLLLTRAKILSDEEVKGLQGVQPQPGLVVLDISFKRPADLYGAQDVRKQFEIRTVYGRGARVQSPVSAKGVVELCKSKFGTQAFIANPKNYQKPTNEEEEVVLEGAIFSGICIDPNETNDKAAILACISLG